LKIGVVQGRNCRIRFFSVGHFDEPESPGAASLLVFDDLSFPYRSIGGKQFRQLLWRARPRQIPHINVNHSNPFKKTGFSASHILMLRQQYASKIFKSKRFFLTKGLVAHFARID
jgi:hypothetical protein